MYQVIIIGGGLAGLLNAIVLGRAGIATLVIEKGQYPFHRVCGEYVSHEVTPFLRALGLFPGHLAPVHIDKLQLSNARGKLSQVKLSPGGFGISRYQLDHFWYEQAIAAKVQFKLATKAISIRFENQHFQVQTSDGRMFSAHIAIGAFGKRSLLDKHLNRSFMKKRSPYIGIKYHVSYPWEPNVIALHNFEKGYCGVSMVEEGKVNICYLSHRDNLKQHGDIRSMEKKVLSKNPRLAHILEHSQPLFEQPLVINEISFAPKNMVDNHVLMTGDAAGLITPLCGNGMAMAIHSAHLLSLRVIDFINIKSYTRDQMETDYSRAWRSHFSYRLTFGRYLQQLFQHEMAMDMLVWLAHFPKIAQLIVRQTHGREIMV